MLFSDDFSEQPTTLIPVETMEDLVWDEDDLEEVGRNEVFEDAEDFSDDFSDEAPTTPDIEVVL